ncbi:hypothetical protein Tco_1050374 [Tanacetum coccineum]
MVVPVEEVYVKALQVKYPIIDWEVYSEDTRKYWKIIRVGNHIEAYQTFDDMLKKFDRDDLEYIHDPLTWRLYDTCGVHHVSTDKGHDIFMLVEKDYPLTRGLLTLMLSNKLQVDQYSGMADELLRKIIIMVNLIPPDHVDDIPIVEPNQHDNVSVVPEPVLVDEDEDPKEDEFEEEDPQEEEDDMEVNIEEDENKPELTYPYKEVDPLNPSPPASESEPEDTIKVENPIEHEDENVPANFHEVGESSTAPFLHENSDGLFPGLMRRDINSLIGRMASLLRQLCRRKTVHALVKKKGKAKDEYYGKLILDLGNEVRSSVEQGTAAMEKLVEKLGNTEEKAECKKLKKELEEARFSNTFLSMQNERVKRDLYWTRVRAHEFYQEMIHRGFVFEERPNKAIDVSVEDEKSSSSELRGPPRDS